MKTILPQILTTCVAALAFVEPSYRPQQPLVGAGGMSNRRRQDKVPGHSDVVYDIVPKDDQQFLVHNLDIAPTPIVPDRRFFVYLAGSLKTSSGLSDDDLKHATVALSGSVTYPDGEREDFAPGSIPLKTTDMNDLAHLSIRDFLGKTVEYLPQRSASLLLDFQIPTVFLKSGIWTFTVDARGGDEDKTSLFAMSLTQWLDGHAR